MKAVCAFLALACPSLVGWCASLALTATQTTSGTTTMALLLRVIKAASIESAVAVLTVAVWVFLVLISGSVVVYTPLKVAVVATVEGRESRFRLCSSRRLCSRNTELV